MAKRRCLLTSYPTNCKDNCFNCDCGGAEATKDAYVSIHNVQRVCAITGGAADTEEGAYIAEVIRNNLEDMVIEAQPVQRWISVDGKLPNIDERVLVYIPRPDNHYNIEIAYISKGDDDCPYWVLGDKSQFYSTRFHYISHWMPLPEPPKGGDV